MKKLLLTTMCMLGLAACANGSNKENNTKKENTMKTIALTKADFLTKVANYRNEPYGVEVPRRQTGAHRLLRIVVRPLQGTRPGSGRAGCRVRRQHLHLQGEYRRGAGTRRRVRHPLRSRRCFSSPPAASPRSHRVPCPRRRSRRPSTRYCSTSRQAWHSPSTISAARRTTGARC